MAAQPTDRFDAENMAMRLELVAIMLQQADDPDIDVRTRARDALAEEIRLIDEELERRGEK